MSNESGAVTNRVWSPKGSTLKFDDGFFSPSDEEGSGSATFLASLDSAIPCVVLLGPPGIGKSTEFRRAVEHARETGLNASILSLAGVYTYELLERTIKEASFDPNEPVTFLFLDALDESPVTAPVVQQWIIDTVQSLRSSHPTARLFLRISARSADWSEQFEEQLRELWGKEGVQVFELPPLTRTQALTFIEQRTSRTTEFFDSVSQYESQAFASRPVTLRMLLESFLAGGSSSPNKVAIYRRGVLALLEETNKVRRVGSKTGDLDPLARFAIASRIATATVLSNKAAIWDGLYSDSIPSNAVPISEIVGGVDRTLGAPLAITAKAIRETLQTGLFRVRTENEFEFAHKTFAEFLAAHFIQENSATAEQALSLIRSKLPSNDRVIPQLREVAAWLAALNADVLAQLVADEPELLLSSDIAVASPSDRKELVARFLSRLDSKETYDKWDWRGQYKRLNHPTLNTQLAPVIRDRAKNIVLRRAAIDIAEACQREDLIPELQSVALDDSEEPHIRAQAVDALGELLPERERQALVPLVFQPGLDPDDEIKGHALAALWPHSLTTQELFASLTPSKNSSFIGSYEAFLYKLDFQNLDRYGAFAALDWISGLAQRENSARSFDKLVPKLLTQIWRCAENPEVLDRLALLALSAPEGYARIRNEVDSRSFDSYYANSPPIRRRALLLAIFKAAPKEWSNARYLTFAPWPIVNEFDLPWIVTELLQKTGPWQDKWLIDLILSLIDWNKFEEISYIWDASEGHPGLKAALEVASFVPFDSPLAEWKREERARRKAKEEEERSHPTQRETIQRLLRETNEDPSKFWILNLALLQDENSHSAELTAVLAPSPGWELLDPNDCSRVVEYALRYLKKHRIDPSYLEPNTVHRPAAAGYRAIRLLFKEDRHRYSQLSEDDWRAWALPIVSFTSNDSSGEQEIHQLIARDCSSRVPQAFSSALSTFLAVTKGFYYAVTLLAGWAGQELQDILWHSLTWNDIQDHDFERAYEELLLRGHSLALQQGREALSELLVEPSIEVSPRTILIAAGYVYSKPEEAWPSLRQIVETRIDSARDLITRLASKWREPGGTDAHAIGAARVADIYVWTDTLFARPAKRTGSHFVRPIDNVFYFQESILRSLVSAGSAESIAALSSIVDRLPNVDWLRWSLADAKEKQRQVEWIPPSPRVALEFVVGQAIEPIPISNKEKILQSAVDDAKATSPKSILDLSQDVAPIVPSPESEPEPKTTTAPTQTLSFLVVNDEWTSGHGGISTFNRQLCAALVDAGHKVFCFIPTAGESEIKLAESVGVTIVRSADFPGLALSELLALGPANKKSLKIDVVIGHDHITGAQALALAHGEFECPYLHVIHTNPSDIQVYKDTGERRAVDHLKSSEKQSAQLKLCAKADAVLVVGPGLERHMRTHLAARSDDDIVCVVPGLNKDLLSFNRRLDRNFESHCLLSGRLDEALIKGTDLFVRIAGEFQKQGIGAHLKGTKFVMRGFVPQTMNDVVLGLRNKYGVKPDNIRAHQYITDEEELLQQLRTASIFLMPSKVEGFGLTGLDAMAAGVPIIVSSESGLGELLSSVAPTLAGDLRKIAEDCVLDVSGDDDVVLEKWVQRLTSQLCDKNRSFANANDLRVALVPKFSWEKAAQVVTQAALRAKKT